MFAKAFCLKIYLAQKTINQSYHLLWLLNLLSLMPSATTASQQRFLALDVFRGLTICFMIIVNTPGNGDTTFAPLLHAHWNGFTPTDLVFPSFMFAVGNAMSFAIIKWQGKPTGYVLSKILKRTFLIFAIGFLMYWFPFFHYNETGHLALNSFSQTRIFGVLQRIGLAYGLASLMLYFFKTRTTVIITCIILFLYWVVMYFFGDPGNPYDIHANAVLKLDTWLIGTNHLYGGEGFPFDPEGLLSTFPSIGNIVAGYVVGQYIRRKGNTYEGLTKLLLAGVLLLFIAHFWNYVFPINKKLWTSPFVLHTVALDCMILSFIIYLVDIRGHRKGIYFFEVPGKNPLFIYLLSELLITVLYMIQIQPGLTVYGWLFQNIFIHATPYLGSLLQAIFYTLVCWSVGYFLDKRKIYVRV